MTSSSTLIPFFSMEYYEHKTQVDKTMFVCSDEIEVNGFFHSNSLNQFCLGYLVNLDRSNESLHYLSRIGRGVVFRRCDDNDFYITSYTDLPVYMIVGQCNDVIKLETGGVHILYDLNEAVRDNNLPPKKKPNIEEFVVRLSFGEPFADNSNMDSLSAPCWLKLDMLKFIEFNFTPNDMNNNNVITNNNS